MPKQLRSDFPVNSKVVTKECLYCRSTFFSNRPFTKYCSDKCRVYYNSSGKRAMPGLMPDEMPGTRQEEGILKPAVAFLEKYAATGQRVSFRSLCDTLGVKEPMTVSIKEVKEAVARHGYFMIRDHKRSNNEGYDRDENGHMWSLIVRSKPDPDPDDEI